MPKQNNTIEYDNIDYTLKTSKIFMQYVRWCGDSDREMKDNLHDLTTALIRATEHPDNVFNDILKK